MCTANPCSAHRYPAFINAERALDIGGACTTHNHAQIMLISVTHLAVHSVAHHAQVLVQWNIRELSAQQSKHSFQSWLGSKASISTHLNAHTVLFSHSRYTLARLQAFLCSLDPTWIKCRLCPYGSSHVMRSSTVFTLLQQRPEMCTSWYRPRTWGTVGPDPGLNFFEFPLVYTLPTLWSVVLLHPWHCHTYASFEGDNFTCEPT